MNKKFSSLLLIVTALVLTITLGLPKETVFADIADGTYEVNYEMKEAGSDNTSIADGYFSKPATLTVENGTKYIQLTVTSADMVERSEEHTSELQSRGQLGCSLLLEKKKQMHTQLCAIG